jgi:hypothetical protein
MAGGQCLGPSIALVARGRDAARKTSFLSETGDDQVKDHCKDPGPGRLPPASNPSDIQTGIRRGHSRQRNKARMGHPLTRYSL